MRTDRLNYVLLTLFGIAFILNFYFQVSGLLGLNRDGTNYFIGVVSDFRPTFYDTARRYSHYLSQIGFITSMYLGIKDLKTLAHIFSANLFILPFLPTVYFFWKSKKSESLTIIPILYLTYFCSFNSLFVISESVAAGALFIVLCGMIFYLDQKSSELEKSLLIFTSFLTLKVYSSFIFFIPVVMILLTKKYERSQKYFFVTTFGILLVSFIYNLYTTITYQFSSIPIHTLYSEYSNLAIEWRMLYYPIGTAFFVLILIASKIYDKARSKLIKFYMILFLISMLIILTGLGIQYLPFFKNAYKNKLSNLFYPLILASLFFIKDRRFLNSNLILSFALGAMIFSSFLNFDFKQRFLLYYENMAIKCSQDIGFDTSMPANQKEQFITEYFSMIPDSILACAFVQMPVKTISYVPELTSFYLFNIKSKETYPDLARYGVKYQIHHESLKN